jgi:hypothetical protein
MHKLNFTGNIESISGSGSLMGRKKSYRIHNFDGQYNTGREEKNVGLHNQS